MSPAEIAIIADPADHVHIGACLQPYNYNISIAVGNEGAFLQQLNQSSPPVIDFCLVQLVGTSSVRPLYRVLHRHIPTARMIVLTKDPHTSLPVPPRAQSAARNPPRIYADVIARALKDGAFGYIQTAAAPPDYKRIIEKLLKFRATIDPLIAKAMAPLLSNISMTPEEKAVFQQLLMPSTSHRPQVLGKVAEGRLYNFLSRLHR